MKRLLLFIIFIVPLSLIAQNEPQVSTIRTTGVGNIRIAPDRAVINMDIQAKTLNFNATIQELNKRAAALEKEIESAGFKKTDLKTTGYVINKNIIYRQDGPVDSGFIGRQSFYLEFPNEQDKIMSLVKTLSKSKVAVDFNFSFKLSDQKQKEVEMELIKRAYKDAEDKAKVIAGASSTTLKKIIRIDYGQPVNQPVPMQFANAMYKEQSRMEDFSGFTVKDLELQDEIVVVWEIAN